jgi:trans-aconitate methyltransferase
VFAEPWSPVAFEEKYRAHEDPWNFARSPFEQARYDDILECLPRRTFRNAYEPGCSVGALTERLAARCERLHANDVSPTVVERARARCHDLPQVTIEVGSVEAVPPPELDLVVFAEIGYYFDLDRLPEVVDRLRAALVGGGCFLACHWLGESTDHQLHGSVVHAELARLLEPTFLFSRHRGRPDYVIDVWTRR